MQEDLHNVKQQLSKERKRSVEVIEVPVIAPVRQKTCEERWDELFKKKEQTPAEPTPSETTEEESAESDEEESAELDEEEWRPSKKAKQGPAAQPARVTRSCGNGRMAGN